MLMGLLDASDRCILDAYFAKMYDHAVLLTTIKHEESVSLVLVKVFLAARKTWIIRCNCRGTCAFSVVMVSSLVATSQNSLCVFVTLSCEGSPKAAATVFSCLCELFSKRHLYTMRARCLSQHLSSVVAILQLRWLVKSYSVLFFLFYYPSDRHENKMFILSKRQRYSTQWRILIPQGRQSAHRYFPSEQLAPFNGNHSNSDYRRPAVKHCMINTNGCCLITSSCENHVRIFDNETTDLNA